MLGFDQCKQVKQLVNAPGFQQQLDAARAAQWVDYSAVTRLKLPVFKALYQWFIEHQSEHAELAQAFSVFKQQSGESLLQLALYDAIHAHLIQKDSACLGLASMARSLAKTRQR